MDIGELISQHAHQVGIEQTGILIAEGLEGLLRRDARRHGAFRAWTFRVIADYQVNQSYMTSGYRITVIMGISKTAWQASGAVDTYSPGPLFLREEDIDRHTGSEDQWGTFIKGWMRVWLIPAINQTIQEYNQANGITLPTPSDAAPRLTNASATVTNASAMFANMSDALVRSGIASEDAARALQGMPTWKTLKEDREAEEEAIASIRKAIQQGHRDPATPAEPAAS